MAEESKKLTIKIKTYKNLFEAVIHEYCMKTKVDTNDYELTIKTISSGFNLAGIALYDATNYIDNRYKERYGLEYSIIEKIVSDVYQAERENYGSKSILYNLHVRNKFDEDDLVKMPYISDKVYKNLPSIFQEATNIFKDKRERDILLTGLLGVISGMLNISGIYRGKKTYSNLYCFIVAPAGSGKGSLIYSKRIALAKQRYMEEASESKQILFIPANISTASLYKHLLDNEDIGILFETEADTMKNSFKQDWGGYSDLLRKAFQFEEVSMRRKDNNTFIRIDKPRLSVVLSGTRNQVFGIIPNTEDGLFSRFIFYTFKSELFWDNGISNQDFSQDDYFEGLSEKLATIIANTVLIGRFSFTDEQLITFHTRFEKWQREVVTFYNEDSISIIRRLADISFRIAMILTATRLGEKGLKDIPIAYCNDIDFETTFQLVEVYKQHSLFVYVTLNVQNKDKLPKVNVAIQVLYDALPDEFKKDRAIVIGKKKEIGELSESTISKYLSKLLEVGQLIQPKYGFYRKVSMKSVESK